MVTRSYPMASCDAFGRLPGRFGVVLTGLVAASAMLTAGTAHAAASSFANLSLSLELIDLNAADGVAPRIYFGRGSTDSYIDGRAGDLVDTIDAFFEYGDTSTRLSGSANARPNASVSASIEPLSFQADGSFSGLDLRTTAQASEQPGTYAGGGGSAAVNLELSDFELTPHTRAVFRTTTSAVTQFDGSGASHFAAVDVALVAYGTDGMGGSQRDTDTVSFRSQTDGGAPQHFAGPMDVSFSNSTGAPIIGTFSLDTTVGAQAYTPAVPEPSQVLLWLAGLGLVGAAARRGAR